MQITCKPHPERQSILTVYCDGSHWREIHTSVFGRKPLLPEHCTSLEDFSEQFATFEHRGVKNYCLRRLSMQSMLSTALKRSLKERLVPEAVIRKVIDELLELRFINDEEWAASFVRSQSSRKVGPRAIAQKLAQKGVRGEKLELALEKSWDVNDQKTMILSLLKSKYAKKDLTDFKEKQKVVASLIRKGFDLSVIFSCIPQRNSDTEVYLN